MNYPKVNLRAIEPEDLDILYAIENNIDLWDVGNANVPYSHYALRDYIAHTSSDIYSDKQVRLMIDNEYGETVGIIDIINFDPQHLRAELGIVIQRVYRERGYGHAAIKNVLSYAHCILHLHQLYVLVDENNLNSISLFENMGFINHSLVLKDWLFDGVSYHNALILQILI